MLSTFFNTDLTRSVLLDLTRSSLLDLNGSELYLNKEGYYLYKLSVPGLSKEDINIDLKGDFLYVSYKKEEDQEHYSFTDSFTKKILLCKNSDKDAIKAKVENGVLTIDIPKTDKKENNSKKIKID